jgi:hypothetical protein
MTVVCHKGSERGLNGKDGRGEKEKGEKRRLLFSLLSFSSSSMLIKIC